MASQLPVPTTVHWHGVAIRDNMDGVPDMTQQPILAGREFTYQFAVTEQGTYWDHDWTLVLDDWIDGTVYTPVQVLASLHQGMAPSLSPMMSSMRRGQPGASG